MCNPSQRTFLKKKKERKLLISPKKLKINNLRTLSYLFSFLFFLRALFLSVANELLQTRFSTLLEKMKNRSKITTANRDDAMLTKGR